MVDGGRFKLNKRMSTRHTTVCRDDDMMSAKSGWKMEDGELDLGATQMA